MYKPVDSTVSLKNNNVLPSDAEESSPSRLGRTLEYKYDKDMPIPEDKLASGIAPHLLLYNENMDSTFNGEFVFALREQSQLPAVMFTITSSTASQNNLVKSVITKDIGKYTVALDYRGAQVQIGKVDLDSNKLSTLISILNPTQTIIVDEDGVVTTIDEDFIIKSINIVTKKDAPIRIAETPPEDLSEEQVNEQVKANKERMYRMV